MDEPEELEYFTILPDTQFGNIRFLVYAYLAFLDSSRLCNVEEHNFPNDKNNFLCVLVYSGLRLLVLQRGLA